MDYFVDCPCGARLKVSAASAGSTVRCKCTRSIAVPRLSQLRLAAGEGAFQAGIVDKIRHMISTGALPLDRECVLTGRLTDDVAEFDVECERVWRRGPEERPFTFAAFALLFVPFSRILRLLFYGLLRQKRGDFGRDTVVRVLLPVCGEFHDRLRRMSQRKLRDLLRTVAVYARLLDEYPKARISVAKVNAQ